MITSLRACPRRIATAALATLALAGAAAGPARAGTYHVKACNAAPGGANNAFVLSSDAGSRISSGVRCPASRSGDGIWLAAWGAMTFDNVEGAQWRLTAPSGTSIIAVDEEHDCESYDGMRAVLSTSAGIFAGCDSAGDEQIGTSVVHHALPNASFVQTHLYCARTSCTTNSSGQVSHIEAKYLDVTLSDATAPAPSGISGTLWTGAWQRGTRTIAFSASDNTGIDGMAVISDPSGTAPAFLSATDNACDYTRAVPCPGGDSLSATIDTHKLSDGQHTIELAASDAAGDVGSSSLTIHVDNTPPAKPAGIAVARGEGWRATNSFDVSWRNGDPGAGSPVASATWTLCRSGGACTTGTASGADVHQLSGLAVPAQGDYTLQVTVTDAAGNVSAQSDPVHLRFDNTPPGKPELAQHPEWLNAVTAHNVTEDLSMPATAVPPSGIAGYVFTMDDSPPTATPGPADVHPAPLALGELPEGTTVLKVRAVSNTGVAASADDVASTTFRVDRTPPSVSYAGVQPGQESSAPVDITIHAGDALSGMTPAPAGEAGGGRIVYRLDGGDPQTVAGDTAHLTVRDLGQHLLSIHAYDVAGNPSEEKQVGFRIAPPQQSTGGGGTIAGHGDTQTPSGGHPTVDNSWPGGIIGLRNPLGGQRGHVPNGRGASTAAKVRAYWVTTRTVRRGHRRVRRTVHVARLTSAYGPRPRLAGTLSAYGQPIAKAVLVVAQGELYGTWRAIGRVRTDSHGRFSARLPTGPSRWVKVIYYPFSDTPPKAFIASNTVRQVVRAAVSLSASPRRLANGHSVGFRGTVRGGHVPAKGVLVSLQVRVGGHWQTFQVVHTNRAGRFRSRYRFQRTYATTTYRFRAYAVEQTGWPFAAGGSRTVKVTVRGR